MNALMKLTDDPLADLASLEGKANVVVPFHFTAPRLDPYHVVRLEIVNIPPDSDSGLVFKVGSVKTNNQWVEKFALTKPALEWMGRAMGISWDADRTGPVPEMTDDNRITFRAVGSVRGADGQPTTITGMAELSKDTIWEEILDEHQEKVLDESFRPPSKYAKSLAKMSPEEKADFLARREFRNFWRYRMARAETSAKLRALRSLGIKPSYLAPELRRPFVFARVDYQPDYSDPVVKDLARRDLQRRTTDLYGSPRTENRPAWSPVVEDQGENGEVVDVETGEVLDPGAFSSGLPFEGTHPANPHFTPQETPQQEDATPESDNATLSAEMELLGKSINTIRLSAIDRGKLTTPQFETICHQHLGRGISLEELDATPENVQKLGALWDSMRRFEVAEEKPEKPATTGGGTDIRRTRREYATLRGRINDLCATTEEDYFLEVLRTLGKAKTLAGIPPTEEGIERLKAILEALGEEDGEVEGEAEGTLPPTEKPIPEKQGVLL